MCERERERVSEINKMCIWNVDVDDDELELYHHKLCLLENPKQHSLVIALMCD